MTLGFFNNTMEVDPNIYFHDRGKNSSCFVIRKEKAFCGLTLLLKFFQKLVIIILSTRNLSALNIFDIKISENPLLDLSISRKTEIKAADILKSKELSTKFCVVHPISRREV